ncbi:MAG TPA: hypothetical protein VGG25_15675 [Streptosporangiaceae bacterium]|jgi:hypothetical protein
MSGSSAVRIYPIGLLSTPVVAYPATYLVSVNVGFELQPGDSVSCALTDGSGKTYQVGPFPATSHATAQYKQFRLTEAVSIGANADLAVTCYDNDGNAVAYGGALTAYPITS